MTLESNGSTTHSLDTFSTDSKVRIDSSHRLAGPTNKAANLLLKLDDVHKRLRSLSDVDDFSPLIEELFLVLHQARHESSPEQWKNDLVPVVRNHTLRKLAHQDPFTRRAFSKPRGYAGDARMLDFIYGREENWQAPPATKVGERVFRFTTQAPASLGVLARRGYIADLLDDVAREKRLPDVLSIACGHAREAQMAASLRRGKIGKFIALDGDPKSLKEAQRCYGDWGLSPVHARIARLITGRLKLGAFDLVYSTGLFDYLNEATSKRLVKVMFDMLKPGGKMVVANYMPTIRDTGYMESLMDWWLVYRTREDMVRITSEVDQHQIDEICIRAEENQNIVFLEMSRR